ncbi:MAG TPA: isocitrate lyase/phosphoenolpyruvate mutase family protein [Steroidobacteraceae bacterium]
MTTQQEKATRFRSLHQAAGVFVIANAWDGASARILTGLGFRALATSSGACAATLGRMDGKITREEALAHARAIVAYADCPVSADLEKGFGDSPQAVAETVRLAAETTGLAGCSIEDATGDKETPLFDLSLAVERITAASQVASGLPFPFTLTARCENYVRGKADLDDTIRRLQAFEKAGADVLFAPGLPDLAAVRAVCSAVSKPVNFMVGIKGKSFSVAELAAAGVRRISLATSLYRTAMTGLIAAAREVKDAGTFGFLDGAITTLELNRFLQS